MDNVNPNEIIRGIILIGIVLGAILQLRYGYRIFHDSDEADTDRTILRLGPLRIRTGFLGGTVMATSGIWVLAAVIISLMIGGRKHSNREAGNADPPADQGVDGGKRAVTEVVREKHPVRNRDTIIEDFHNAVIQGDISRVNQFLESGGYYLVNTRDEDSYTPLHLAAREGHGEIVNLLVTKGAHFNLVTLLGGTSAVATLEHDYRSVNELVRDSSKFQKAIDEGDIDKIRALLKVDVDTAANARTTPLHLAAQNGHIGIVRILLGRGADANATDENNATALHLAASHGRLDVVRALVRKCDVAARDYDQATAVHRAAASDHHEIVAFLLKNDRSVINTADKDGSTPLHIAAGHGHIDTTNVLIKQKGDLNAINNAGDTPLHVAAAGDHAKIVECLLENGACFDPKNTAGLTPLEVASQTRAETTITLLRDLKKFHDYIINGDLKHTEILLQQKPSLLLSAVDRENFSPLHHAAARGYNDIIRLIIDNESFKRKEIKNTTTPLHLAAQNNHVDIIKTLIDNEFSSALPNEVGRTALQIAAAAGNNEVVAILIPKSEINAADLEGRTALHLAAENDHETCVELLLAKSADLMVNDSAGVNVLHLASAAGNQAIVRLLLSKGMNPNAADNYNNTSLHYACWHGNTDVVELLLRHGTAFDTKNRLKDSLVMTKDTNPSQIIGSSPLRLAELNQHKRIVEVLQRIALFHDAVGKGETDKVIASLRTDRDLLVNAKNSKGIAPLHLAIAERKRDIIEILLENGAFFDLRNLLGTTPSSQAVWYGFKDIAAYLNQIEIFHLAVKNGDLKRLRSFLESNRKLFTSTRNSAANTAVHVAAFEGQYDAINVLLLAGAPYNSINLNGNTPLDLAAKFGHDTIEKLLQQIANCHKAAKTGDLSGIQIQTPDESLVIVNARDHELRTPLIIAASRNHPAIVERLLAGDSSEVNARNERGRTALHLAAAAGYTEIVKILLNIDTIDPSAGDVTGKTPLHLAAQSGHDDVVIMLLTQNINVNAKDEDGNVPLHFAAAGGHRATSELLINHGAFYDTRNNIGVTPLYGAQRNRHTDVAALLGGIMHFRKAVEDGDLDSIKTILDTKADYLINSRSDNALTALHLATLAGQENIIEILVENNIDLSAKNKDGKTALNLAEEAELESAVQILRRKK